MQSFAGNRVVRDTGSEYPIFQAPIGFMSRSQWVKAISSAGGMGLVETALLGAEELEREAAIIREHTNRPFGFHLLPDQLSAKPDHEADVLDWLEKVRASFVTVGYGGYSLPGAPDKWRFIKRLKDAGTTCYYVVDTIEQALRSEDAGVDGLILGGAEAGGVRGDDTLHIFSLIQAARRRTDLPLVASGGIADGIGMAGAFALGAEGILMGTRLMASEECPIHANYKQQLADAERIFYLQFGLPEVKMLVVENDYSNTVKRGEIDPKGNPYAGDALKCFYEGRTDLAMVGGGESAVLFDSVKPVADIIEETVSGFWDEIRRLSKLVA